MARGGQSGATDKADYAGDVSADECWKALAHHPDAILIDVRTDAEWSFVGVPDLSKINKKVMMVSWQIFPAMEHNSQFLAAIESFSPDKNRPLYFLCRSGGRSRSAAIAAAAAGWRHSYNIAGGFEGDLDAERHRGKLGGWKAAGLPWLQN